MKAKREACNYLRGRLEREIEKAREARVREDFRRGLVAGIKLSIGEINRYEAGANETPA